MPSNPGDYPYFVFKDCGADPRWVQLVEKVVRSFDFEESFSKPYQEIYKLHRKWGWEWTYSQMIQHAPKGDQTPIKWDEPHRVGNVIFELICRQKEWTTLFPADWETQFSLPVHDVQFMPQSRYIVVFMRSLLKKKMANGYPAYYSRREPQIDVDGKSLPVVFSKHAMERLYHRICSSKRTYFSWGDAFAFFDGYQYFEKVQLTDDKGSKVRGVSVFNDCFFNHFDPAILSWSQEYANRVIGFIPQFLSIENKYHWYYRAGYAPYVVESDHVLLKSFLPPGYRGTPEWDLIMKKEPLNEREKRLAATKNWTVENLRDNFDYSLIKWFHRQGIHQVVPIDGEVFGLPYQVLSFPNNVSFATPVPRERIPPKRATITFQAEDGFMHTFP